MPFDLQLSITGLHAIVARRADSGSDSDLQSVDLVAPATCHGTAHVPRLVFPADKIEDGEAGPLSRSQLIVTPEGRKLTVLDITDRVVAIEPQFAGKEPERMRAVWGEVQGAPIDARNAHELNWVPSAAALGIKDIPLPGDPAAMPDGAHARLRLTGGGRLFASKIVCRPDGQPLLWDFPAAGYERAIADEVVFELTGLVGLYFHLSESEWVRVVDPFDEGRVAIGYSHDVARIAGDELLAADLRADVLDHMSMLGQVSVGGIQVPRPAGKEGYVRTAYPICPSALLVV